MTRKPNVNVNVNANVNVNVNVKSLYDKKTKWFQETRLSWEH